jgi:PAS domain S-box-containing protein
VFLVTAQRLQRRQTEPVGTEEALRDSMMGQSRHETAVFRDLQEVLNAFVNSSMDWIWAVDLSGHHTYSNHAVERILGYSVEEMQGMGVTVLLHPEDRETVEARWPDWVTARQGWRNLVLRWRAKDGHYRYLDSTAVPIIDPHGELQGFCGVDRDITERMRVEDALRTREAQLSNALRMAHAGHWEYDVASDTFTFNDMFYDVFRTSVREVGGYKMPSAEYARRFCHPDDRFLVGKATKAAVETDDPHYSHELEHRILYPNGEIGYVAVRFFVAKDAEGGTVKVHGVNQDVTKRKQAEEKRMLLAEAIEQATETVVITDVTGAILYVNPAFEETTGYARQEVLGKNPSILKSGKQDADFYRQMWDTLTAGNVWRGRFVNKRKDGKLYQEEAVISPVRDTAGEVVNYIALKLDVTREARLERQLQQAQKMESIGRLAGGVAHDFNNMLGVISGYTDIVLGDMAGDDPRRADLEEVQRAAVRSVDLTRQLLALARRQSAEPRLLNLNEVLSNSEKMLGRLVGEDVELAVTAAEDLWLVKVDPSQVDQILANLAVNARDAIHGTGRIAIETRNVVLDEEDCLDHAGSRPGAFVRLTFSDTGVGMDKETLAHAFEPFFTTKPVGVGTGLGLATVYGIVRQNDGYVHVDSELGAGTTFRIDLPRCGEVAETGSREPLPVCVAGTETVLVTEDEEQILNFCRTALIAEGYQVIAATRPDEALLLAQAHKGDIDLLITDVIMPEMNGRQLGERIQRLRPGVKILYMSGYPADVITHRGILDRGFNLLQKPFLRNELAARVRQTLDSRN